CSPRTGSHPVRGALLQLAVRLEHLRGRLPAGGAGSGKRPGRGLLGAGERPRGLARGPEGDVLGRRGERDLAAEDRGGQLLDGFAAGGAADQGDAGGGGAGALLERGDAVSQGAQQTLHVRAGDVLTGGGGAHAGEGGAGVGPVGGALSVEVGQQGDAVG